MPFGSAVEYNKFKPIKNLSRVASSVDDPVIPYRYLLSSVPDFDSAGRVTAKLRAQSLGLGSSNPPFRYAIAGRINPAIPNGQADMRILRGFIRRVNNGDNSDITSSFRLNFMYNPEAINRSYLSYLDQQALDPFNSVYGSDNSTAAPGILDFSFELLFDRQSEVASDPDHRGVLVDMDYFDLVVRGAVPDSASNNSTQPDSGVMMVNPRDVVVVFSPKLAVKGRVYNAAVRYERFNHRMTPTRVRISITMKAFYVGPASSVPGSTDYRSESRYAATIKYDESITVQSSYEDIKVDSDQIKKWYEAQAGGAAGTTTGGTGSPGITYSSSVSGPVPAGTVLTYAQVADIVLGVGLRGDTAATSVAICNAESGFKVDSYGGPNTNGTYDRGLWQINTIHTQYDTKKLLSDPYYNAGAMMDLSSRGQDWTPWSSYKNGRHLPFMNDARNIIQAKGGYSA